jgi:hypothetical protein
MRNLRLLLCIDQEHITNNILRLYVSDGIYYGSLSKIGIKDHHITHIIHHIHQTVEES